MPSNSSEAERNWSQLVSTVNGLDLAISLIAVGRIEAPTEAEVRRLLHLFISVSLDTMRKYGNPVLEIIANERNVDHVVLTVTENPAREASPESPEMLKFETLRIVDTQSEMETQLIDTITRLVLSNNYKQVRLAPENS